MPTIRRNRAASAACSEPLRWRVALLLAAVASAVPLWCARFLPLADLPQHVAAIGMLRHWWDPALHLGARYALNVSSGVKEIALTHVDRLAGPRLASIFADASKPGQYETHLPLEFIDRVEQLLRTPITMLSSGPTADHRKERQPEVSEAA